MEFQLPFNEKHRKLSKGTKERSWARGIKAQQMSLQTQVTLYLSFSCCSGKEEVSELLVTIRKECVPKQLMSDLWLNKLGREFGSKPSYCLEPVTASQL